MILTYIVA